MNRWGELLACAALVAVMLLVFLLAHLTLRATIPEA